MNATIEDEVRTMLARRAADVADDDVATPPLPSGLRIAVDERPPPLRERTRWLAVAAAVVLLLGAAGLVISGRDTDADRTDTTDPTTIPALLRPLHLSRLPLGVDPTVGPVRGLGRPAPTPEEAADVFMADAFGEDVMSGDPFTWPDADADEVWAAHRTPLVGFDPAAWPGTEDDRATGPAGTVTARRTGAGWYVVAVTNAALDLRDVRYDEQGLSGEVRSTSSAPLRVVVSTVLGEQLATSDLTTWETSDRGPSVLPLDGIAIDPSDQPVVLRVEAGDRPGQITIDGVRAAALATVVLPAPADADPAPPLSTTEPSPPETTATATESELSIDTPLAAAVEAALPEGVEVVRADGATTLGPAGVVMLTAADGEAASYQITVFRPVPSAEDDSADPLAVSWGRAWLTADEPTLRSLYAEREDGPGVGVVHLDPGGAAASVGELLAIAEVLVADPVVAGVAAGGDPNG